MTKVCWLIVLMAFSLSCRPQSIQISGDTTLCLGGSVTLRVDTTNIGTNRQLYVLNEDKHSLPVDIGFDFPFYDSIYDKCLISDNGYITFDLTFFNTYSAWHFEVDMPDSLWFLNENQPANRIMFPWADYSADTGSFSSTVCGTNPNRKFILTFDRVSIWHAGPPNVFQVVLHELSGVIEMNILRYPPYNVGVNAGKAIQGLVNSEGNLGHIVQGRNFSDIWTTPDTIQYDSHRFTPDGFGGYTIDTIPFSFINTEDKIFWNGNRRYNLIRDVDPDSSMWFKIEMEYACGIQELIGSELLSPTVSDSIFLTVNNCAGVNELDQNHFILFPNPTTGRVHVNFHKLVKEAVLSVLDVQGKLIQKEQLHRISQIDLSLPETKGVYFIQVVFSDGSSKSLKVMKER